MINWLNLNLFDVGKKTTVGKFKQMLITNKTNFNWRLQLFGVAKETTLSIWDETNFTSYHLLDVVCVGKEETAEQFYWLPFFPISISILNETNSTDHHSLAFGFVWHW